MNGRSDERYGYSCERCGCSWMETYEVAWRPGSMVATRVFLRDGFPVNPPRYGKACRTCGGHLVVGRRLPAA